MSASSSGILSSGTSGTLAASSLSLSSTSSQLVTSSGNAHKATISVPTPAQNTVFTLSDPGVSAVSVMTAGGDGTVHPAIAYQFPSSVYAGFGPIGSASAVNAPQFNVQGTDGVPSVIAFQTSGTRPYLLNVSTPGQVTTVSLPDPGASSANIVLTAGAQTITGALTLSSAVAANGGVTFAGIAGSTPTTLTNYCEFTHSTNWSGPLAATAANIAVTVIGRLVSLDFVTLNHAGNSTAASIVSSVALPSWMWPQNAPEHQLTTVVNAGATVQGSCWIQTTGLINWYAGVFTTNFTASTGVQGWDAQSMFYTIPITAARGGASSVHSVTHATALALAEYKETKRVPIIPVPSPPPRTPLLKVSQPAEGGVIDVDEEDGWLDISGKYSHLPKLTSKKRG